MQLPDEFQFSASALQDFLDCPQRFYLRHVLGLAWPARVTEPIREYEAHLARGSAFHRLVQQHQNGVPAELLDPLARAGGLGDWWQSYLACEYAARPDSRPLVEFPLSAPFCGARLYAKYDLILVEDPAASKNQSSGDEDPATHVLQSSGDATDRRLVIVDWKTSRKRPGRDALLAQAQTRVYRYLLALAGNPLVGREVAPAEIRMVYWFAGFPAQPEVLDYSPEQFSLDADLLQRTADEILGRSGPEDFNRTAREAACKTCLYSTYCERGGSPVPLEERESAEGGEDFEIDFDSIPEVAF